LQRGETKNGAVISGDMILKWKRIWSQVAAGLRSPFRQKGPTSARTFHRHGSSRVLKKAAPVVAGLPTEPSSETPREHLCPNCHIPLRGSCHRNLFGIITPCLSAANPNDALLSFRPKTPATAPPVVTDPHVGCIISSTSLFESH